MIQTLSIRAAVRGPTFATVAACLLLGGCGDNPDERAVLDAANELKAASLTGSLPAPRPLVLDIETEDTPAPRFVQRAKYNNVVNTLRSVDPNSASSGPANALTADAQAGLGALASATASDMELRFASQVASARRALSRYKLAAAQAQALRRFDVTDIQSQLQQTINDSRERIDALQADRDRVLGRIAELEADADRARTTADQIQARALQLRVRADDAPASTRADLFREARGIAREADSYQREAAEIEALIRRTTPEADELAKSIRELEDQIAFARDELGSLAGRVQRNQDEIAAFDAQAEQASQEFRSIVTGPMVQARADADGPWEEADAAYRKAAASARAVQGSRAASMKAAIAQIAIADIADARARALELQQDLLLAASRTLDEGSGFGQRARELGQRIAQLREDSAAALQQAAPLLRAAGEEAQDLIAQRTGQPRSTETEQGSDDPRSQDDQQGGPEAEIRDTLEQFANAARDDLSALPRMIKFSSESEREVMTNIISLLASAERFDKACIDHFGSGFQDLLDSTSGQFAMLSGIATQASQGPAAGTTETFDDLADLSSDRVQIQLTSETSATVTHPDHEEPLFLVKESGRWLMDSAAMSQETGGGDAQQAEMMMEMMRPMFSVFAQAGQMLDDLAAQIKQDGFQTPDAMLTELQSRLTAIMESAGPDMMGMFGGMGAEFQDFNPDG